jgi:predicted RNA-binding Zn ribbon-like protein
VKRMAHVLPAWLEPVLAFVNTVDVETGVDELAPGPTALSGWLADHGLLADPPSTAAAPVSRADHRLAIDLRSGLRSLALLNNGGPADEPAMLRMRRALDRLPLAADASPADTSQADSSPGTGPPGLRPHRLAPVRAALGTIVASYAQAVATGHWGRIRRCPAEDCAWVFWDSSAKGSRRWCTMTVCGNRSKVRAFAQRRSGR